MPTVQSLPASVPELIVSKILDKMEISYEFQSSFLGGRTQAGGVIADFYIPTFAIIISVLGEYYHYGMNRTGQDILQRVALESQGIHTIFIDESDVIKNARFYVEQALMGIDHSKASRL